MQSKDGDALDAIDALDALGWESWRPARPPAAARRSRLPSAMLAIVVLAHGLVACFALLEDTRRVPAVAVEAALLIDFIERLPAQPPARQRADPAQRRASHSTHPVPPSRHNSETSLQILASQEQAAAPLRLRLESDPSPMTESPAARNLSSNASSSPYDPVLLHGRPHLRGVRLHLRPSPKLALAMLGALVGSPPYDPCPVVSARLANLHSERHELDLAADLLTRERHCQR